MKRHILLMDNDPEFLKTYSRLLESYGYTVTPADSLEAGRRLLSENHFHAAVIDVRMRNDQDDKDISGIYFAREQPAPLTPKIMLTDYPNVGDVRRAVGYLLGAEPPAVDYVSKKENGEPNLAGLVEAIENAVANRRHVNPDLRIHCAPPLTWTYLAGLAASEAELEVLPSRAEEMEDLFRDLFFDYEQVTLSRLLWNRPGQLALQAGAFSPAQDGVFVVVCGRAAQVNLARQNYQQAGSQMRQAPILAYTARTNHYAALAWSLPSASIEYAVSFVQFCLEKSERQIRAAVEHFCQETLAPWHRQGQEEKETQQLYILLRRLFGLAPEEERAGALARVLQALTREAQAYRMVKEISFSGGQAAVQLNNGQVVSGPDPGAWLSADPASPPGQPAAGRLAWGNVPFPLALDTLLVDEAGQTWMSDYSQLARLPVLLDFVSLEEGLRSGLLRTSNLLNLVDFEKELAAVQDLGQTSPPGDVEPECRRALAAIQAVRSQATGGLASSGQTASGLPAGSAGEGLLTYFAALLFQTLAGLLSFSAERRHTPGETTAGLHRLVLILLLGGRLEQLCQAAADAPAANAPAGIQIDAARHEVRVDGRLVALTPTQFQLLSYLHARANQLCTRAEILRDVFEFAQPDLRRTKSLINTQITRLRQKIEKDPQKPRYLFNVRGEGYKLVLPGEG